MSEPALKFCKDCRWFVADQEGISVFAATCANPRAQQEPRYNLVSGDPVVSKPFCHRQREPAVVDLTGPLAERFCGPAGRWWEPRFSTLTMAAEGSEPS